MDPDVVVDSVKCTGEVQFSPAGPVVVKPVRRGSSDADAWLACPLVVRKVWHVMFE